MKINFEWDARKARVNKRKHRVSFDEASTVFADPLSVTISDPLHWTPGEERFVTVGLSSSGQLLVVVHLEWENRLKIISARHATAQERRNYEEER